jgi:hypothetical protein
MTPSQATAEVFLTALRALSKGEREKVMVGIARDKRMWEDIQDLAVFEKRKSEKSEPYPDHSGRKRRRA